MYGARKFNQESYNQNDSLGKKLLLKHLQEVRGHKILNSGEIEDYDHDIVTEKNDQIFHFEVEMKRNRPFTSVDDYPFPTVSFTGRKKRLHEIKPFQYIIICHETCHAVGCHSSGIYKPEYIEEIPIDTEHRKGNDQLYRVPKENCYYFRLN